MAFFSLYRKVHLMDFMVCVRAALLQVPTHF